MEHGDTFVIGRERCPRCEENGRDNSGDNLARYNDDHAYCYSCKYYEKGDGSMKEPPPKADFKIRSGTYRDLSDRRLEETTLRKYGYQVIDSEAVGEVHLNSYYNSDNKVIAQKFRQVEGKQFKWTGEPRLAGLFGQHLFEGGKKLTITEGELDAMSVYQVNGGWPVVSLNNGVGNVEKNIKDNLEWLCRFDEIVIMFDNDKPGREAASIAAQLLPPGRVKIATLPYKDANECLVHKCSKDIISATWQAKLYSPDEIIHISDVEADDAVHQKKVWPYPWRDMTRKVVGQRSAEIVLWGSDTGSGKSTVVRELAIHHVEQGRGVGMIMLEESPDETKKDLISLMINAPVREINAMKMLNEMYISMDEEPEHLYKDYHQEDYEKAEAKLDGYPLHLYNHLGHSAYSNVLARMEYMAVSLELDVIILDHVTALATGLMADNGKDNEVQMTDQLMKDLRSLVERTGVHIDLVAQLRKTPGKSYADGDHIDLEDFRGSKSLTSVPNMIFGMERRAQEPDPFVANCTGIRCLKNRLTGKRSVVAGLFYNHITGRLEEADYTVVKNEDGANITVFKKKE